MPLMVIRCLLGVITFEWVECIYLAVVRQIVCVRRRTSEFEVGASKGGGRRGFTNGPDGIYASLLELVDVCDADAVVAHLGHVSSSKKVLHKGFFVVFFDWCCTFLDGSRNVAGMLCHDWHVGLWSLKVCGDGGGGGISKWEEM